MVAGTAILAMWQDDNALAEVAGCEERIAGNPELDAPFRVGVLAAIGPEARGVVRAGRGGDAEVHPVLVQEAFAADHAVIEIEQAEPRPVPGARQHPA